MKFFFNKRPKSGAAVIEDVLIHAEALATPADKPGEEELAVVIGLAINLYVSKLQAYENTVITIQKVMKPYSPWSSKIYGMRQQPLHIPCLRTRLH